MCLCGGNLCKRRLLRNPGVRNHSKHRSRLMAAEEKQRAGMATVQVTLGISCRETAVVSLSDLT